MNYLDLNKKDIDIVKTAIKNGENFYGYIPENGLKFIVRNYKELHKQGCLEANWIDAYLHAFNFRSITFETIKAIFDQCGKSKLRSLHPLPQKYNAKHPRFSLFRGCAANRCHKGMSWTSSLDKAIWYAAYHKEYEHYSGTGECSVYTTTVNSGDIYCYLGRNEPEFIVSPKTWWKIDIPQTEFTLGRSR